MANPLDAYLHKKIHTYTVYTLQIMVDLFVSSPFSPYFIPICCFLCPDWVLSSLSRIELSALGPQRSDQNHHFCSVPETGVLSRSYTTSAVQSIPNVSI